MAFHPRDPRRTRGAGQGAPPHTPAKPPRAQPVPTADSGEEPAAAKRTRAPHNRPSAGGKPPRSSAAPKATPTPPSRAEPQEPERVARALARAGVSSRRDAERLIEAGRVAINGQVLSSPAVNVGPGDILTLDGVPVADPEKVRVWRYHKPNGLLTTHKDPKGRQTVFETLPKEMGRVISVGRLDLNSEGVLLLTNDGALARALELPSNGWVRRYRARAFGRVTQERLDALKNGVTIEGVNYGPVEASMEKSGGGSNIWITVAISEGKNREVRRVLEHVGLKVNRLIRVSYGPFDLGDLEPGAVAEVPPRVIRETLAGAIPPGQMPAGDRKLFNWTPERRFNHRPATLGDDGAPVRETARDSAPRPRKPAVRQTDTAETRPPVRGSRRERPETEEPASRGRRAGAAGQARSTFGAKPEMRTAPAGRAPSAKRTTGETEKAPKPSYKAGWAKPKAKSASKRPAGAAAKSRRKPDAPRPPKR